MYESCLHTNFTIPFFLADRAKPANPDAQIGIILKNYPRKKSPGSQVTREAPRLVVAVEFLRDWIALQTSDGYTIQPMYIYTENAMQVSKWGNSLAVRLPAAVVDALGLKEGDHIEIQVAGKRLFDVAKAPGARELLARLRKFRGRLPATFKFDRLDANERR